MPDFSALKTRVKDYLIDVPTKTNALVGDWINLAVREAEERFNFKHMKSITTLTTTEGTSNLSNPIIARFKSFKEPAFSILDDEFNTMRELGMMVSSSDVFRRFGSDETGAPEYISFEHNPDRIVVYPIPDGESDYSDGEYRIFIEFWRYSAPLVNNSDTNWFTDNAEWYVTFRAVAEGMLFNRDHGEAEIYFGRANAELLKHVRTNKQTQHRLPRQVVPRTGVYGVSRKPPRR